MLLVAVQTVDSWSPFTLSMLFCDFAGLGCRCSKFSLFQSEEAQTPHLFIIGKPFHTSHQPPCTSEPFAIEMLFSYSPKGLQAIWMVSVNQGFWYNSTEKTLFCSLFWFFLILSLYFYGTIYHDTKVLLQNANCYFRSHCCLCRSRLVFPHMHHFTVIHNEFQLLFYCPVIQSR